MGVREEFLSGAEAVRELLGNAELTRRWDDPSALPGFRVGGLAGHLVRAVTATVDFLQTAVPDDEPEGIVEFFVWASSGWAEQAGPIIERGEQQASGGPQVLLATYDRALVELERQVADSAPDRRAVRNGRVLAFDDLLVIRALELIAHADDLAASLEVGTPGFGADLTDRVIDLLVTTAISRHGRLGVLRALTRRERDTIDALRVI